VRLHETPGATQKPSTALVGSNHHLLRFIVIRSWAAVCTQRRLSASSFCAVDQIGSWRLGTRSGATRPHIRAGEVCDPFRPIQLDGKVDVDHADEGTVVLNGDVLESSSTDGAGMAATPWRGASAPPAARSRSRAETEELVIAS
jgi:hypothetical protein